MPTDKKRAPLDLSHVTFMYGERRTTPTIPMGPCKTCRYSEGHSDGYLCRVGAVPKPMLSWGRCWDWEREPGTDDE